MRDVVIIGGGHNGLVAAAFLARAGLKPLVLERAERVGGCAVTEEIAPGFRCPALSHRAAIDRGVMRALGLERHGLKILRSEALVCAPAADGRWLTLWAETARAQDDIGAFSPRDAERYPAFLASLAATSGVLRGLLAAAPPPLDDPSARDFITLLKAGRAFRALGRPNAYRLLRWLPMAVADLAQEWFESEPLRAVVAAGGVLGSFVGPRSAGSAAVLLALSAGEGHPIAPGWAAQGGPGAISGAIAAAAREAGVEVRPMPMCGRSPLTMAWRLASCLRQASGSTRGSSCRTPTPGARSSGWSIRSTSRLISSAVFSASACAARSRK